MQIFNRESMGVGALSSVELLVGKRYEFVFSTGGINPPSIDSRTVYIPLAGKYASIERGYYDAGKGKYYIVLTVTEKDTTATTVYQAGISIGAVLYLAGVIAVLSLSYLSLLEINELTEKPAGLILIGIAAAVVFLIVQGRFSKWSGYY